MTRRTRFLAIVGAAPLLGAAFGAPGAFAQQPGTQPQRTSAATRALDSAITPAIDPQRAMEAEIRIALADLFTGRTVSALKRLQFLASSPAVTASTNAPAQTTMSDRNDVLFLLAQAQYRLGMDSAFTANAQTVLASGPARYAPLLRTQLLLSAYRSGDYARVASLGQQMAQDQTRGLASLVAGLAAYQTKNYAQAASQFAATKQAGPPYAQYAEYMDVLTTLRSDTTQSAAALSRLQALAQSATGEFADQVRLTAAQLAYQNGANDQAITLANAVSATGGLAPAALLTKAWAQYKSKDVAGAGQSFAAFADRYPQLPQRDEARLMAAQSLLQLGRSDEAARLFHLVADSGRTEEQQLSTGAQGAAMMDLARAVVQARAAGLLFVADPVTGKTIVLEENAGSDPSALAAALTGGNTVAPSVGVARLISFDDLAQRFKGLDTAVKNPALQRVLFAPPSPNASQGTFTQQTEAVLAADVQTATAELSVRQAMRNERLREMQIRGIQRAMAGRGDTLTKLMARIDSTTSRSGRVLAAVDSTESHLKAALVTQVRNVRGGPAYIVQVRADSLRQQGQIPPGVDVEALVAAKADSMINALPLFLLADSARIRMDRMRTQLAESRVAIDDAQKMFATAAPRDTADSSAIPVAMRSALEVASNNRKQAESSLVAAVSTELQARATELLATLRHDMQAAEFGTATSTFFRAIGQTGPDTTGAGGTGTSGTSAAGGGAGGRTVTSSSGALADSTALRRDSTARADSARLRAVPRDTARRDTTGGASPAVRRPTGRTPTDTSGTRRPAPSTPVRRPSNSMDAARSSTPRD